MIPLSSFPKMKRDNTCNNFYFSTKNCHARVKTNTKENKEKYDSYCMIQKGVILSNDFFVNYLPGYFFFQKSFVGLKPWRNINAMIKNFVHEYGSRKRKRNIIKIL